MHKDILQAATNIVRKEGHGELSLRRLANDIDYSPTVLYLYFKNKEALELALAKWGYQQLNSELKSISKFIVNPVERLNVMLVTYFQFATLEKQLYLLIQEVERRTEDLKARVPESEFFAGGIDLAINEIYPHKQHDDQFIKLKRYAFMAALQGIISIHLTHRELPMHTKTVLLTDAINRLLKS